VHKAEPVINEAHFQDIQNRILKALDNAEVSIIVVMAWFTNDALFQKLVEKHKQGLDVKLAIYDDGINKKHGVDITQFPHKKIKRGQRGGLMHNKFCVVDNQIVITGSYNWSDNAEFRNDENVTVENDPKQATKYSVEYRKLTS
jgi:phosphatidylserine/phosphatidylglycerophosphate/cardiolipin synthase-like enzyme